MAQVAQPLPPQYFDATVMYMTGVKVEHATFREHSERAARTRAYRFCCRMGIHGFKIECATIGEV